ncbi:MAG: 4-phosphopantoate--beta-alanine ligase [Thermoplasmata archaeon]
MKIPKTHPRYQSLITREKLVKYMKKGIVAETGLIAHGRGETFDYLIGEKTTPEARMAEKVAACYLLLAKNPVVSVNGNTAALCSKDIVKLAKLVPLKIEINLFHRTKKRMKNVAEELKRFGAANILGEKLDARIPGLLHNRGLCAKNGIFGSDVVLIPLEDGDRAGVLKKMGKIVIAIDLNPVSRTSIAADVTIVDNVVRAIPEITNFVKMYKTTSKKKLKSEIEKFDNKKSLLKILKSISQLGNPQ